MMEIDNLLFELEYQAGRQDGMRDCSFAIAREMKQEGFLTDTIMKLTGLTFVEIEEL